MPPNSLIPARVTGREHHQYEVVCPDFSGRPGFEGYPSIFGRHGNLRVTGRFGYGAEKPADYPAIGDWVLVDPTEAALRIHSVLPRRSVLSRGRAGEKTEEQVLAANIDTLFLVSALDGGRNFLPRFLERGLAVARNSGAIPFIILNKVDLANTDDRTRALNAAAHVAPTVPLVAVSARTGEGIDELRAFISSGETVGMLGKSGVGKSALVNALGGSGGERDATAREGQVREYDLRGRHTTSSSRLYQLDSGILLIDSPGIRELKVWGDAEDLEGGFPEITELAGRCRFSDCTHMAEAGCAVLGALDSGELDGARYQAYVALMKEQAWLECRNDEQARHRYEQKWKQISKLQKELKRSRM
jgi:ribosome biogenesis GTPase